MSQEKVLIIEDDPTMLRGLKDNFRFKGYHVIAVEDGREGLEAALREDPDLIVLDIMLPHMDGYQVCSALRSKGREMPVIMLTAKGNEADIIRGLNVGANDYMTKPFSIKELLARAQGLLDRGRRDLPDIVQFGECTFNFSSHKLFRDGGELTLTPKEGGLLKFFIRNAGRALTREIIMDNVWGRDLIVTPRSVDRCINTLRNKVEPDPPQPSYIKTIRDIGYRFELDDSKTPEPVQGHLDVVDIEPLAKGLKLGVYEVLEKVGPDLFKALSADGEQVWIYSPQWVNQEEVWNVCREEGRALIHKTSAGVVPLKAFSRLQGHACIITAQADGAPLSALMEEGPLGFNQLVTIGLAVARTLADMDVLGVLHLGLDPNQIWVDDHGVRVLGYGMGKARLYHVQTQGHLAMLQMGDPAWMAPEQLRGAENDRRTDIFALGSILAGLATGTAPFARETPAEAIAAVLRDPPPDLMSFGAPKALQRLVAHCMEKDPTTG